jgi:hypothetical protein
VRYRRATAARVAPRLQVAGIAGLLLATPGNGRQRWRHLLASTRF